MQGEEVDFSRTGDTIRSTLFLLESNSVSMYEKEAAVKSLSEELNRSELQISLSEKKQREMSDTLHIEMSDFERTTDLQKKSLKADKNNLVATLAQLEKEQERLKQKNAELACQFQEVEDRLARLAMDFSEGSGPTSDDGEEEMEMDMTIEAMRQEISELSDKQVHIAEQIGIVKSTIIQKESQIVKIKREMLTHTAEIKKLKHTIATQKGDYQNEIREQRRILALNKDQTQSAESEVANLKTKLAEQRRSLAQNERMETKYTNEEHELENKKAKLTTAIADKQKEIKSISKKLLKDQEMNKEFCNSQNAIAKQAAKDLDRTVERKKSIQKAIEESVTEQKENEKRIKHCLSILEALKKKTEEEDAAEREIEKCLESAGKSETESERMKESDDNKYEDLEHELVTVHQEIQAAIERKREIDERRFKLQEYSPLALLKKEYDTLRSRIETTIETNEKLKVRISRKEKKLLKQRREEMKVREALGELTNKVLLFQRDVLQEQNKQINRDRSMRAAYAMEFLRLRGGIVQSETRSSALKYSSAAKKAVLSHIHACRNIKPFPNDVVLIGKQHCCPNAKAINKWNREIPAWESLLAEAILMKKRLEFASYPQTQKSLMNDWQRTLETVCQRVQ